MEKQMRESKDRSQNVESIEKELKLNLESLSGRVERQVEEALRH